MPDYYIAEDGTIHDREAEHRSRTQHTAAPAVADTTAEDTPEVSFARQFVYWLFALSASVFAAVCVCYEMQAAFTPPAPTLSARAKRGRLKPNVPITARRFCKN